MITRDDIAFMGRAITLARRGLGRTSPNPAVGAVVVRDGKVVGEGYHKKAGTPHAEVNALASVRGETAGATLYVTLEPCNHEGRTPPCTRAILEAGIRRVVIGTRDPNPKVAGNGARFLASHGVQVEMGCREAECRLLIAPFAKHSITGLPWIRAKVACSLDGRIATRTGHSRWITNERARAYGHHLRDISDAILVGRGTVLADDPELTCRLTSRRGMDPLRVILDSRLSLDPARHKVFRPCSTAETWIIAVEGARGGDAAAQIEKTGARVKFLPPDPTGRVDLSALLEYLGACGIQSILVEGGATVHGSFFDHGLVDEAFFFQGPIIIGGKDAPCAVGGTGCSEISQATRLHQTEIRRIGDNWLVHGLITDVKKFFEIEEASRHCGKGPDPDTQEKPDVGLRWPDETFKAKMDHRCLLGS